MADPDLPFDTPYRHGFVRIAVAVPRVHLADPVANLAEIRDLASQASDRGVALTVFPELCLTGYSADDLFHQRALLDAAREALDAVVEDSRRCGSILVVGAPLMSEGKLFICAVVVYGGRVLGVVPKSYLPNYREYYEGRQFSRAAAALSDTIAVGEALAPFGSLVFDAGGASPFSFFIEICEDLWVPSPPSARGALAGATLLCNLSASNTTVAKNEYRHALCRAHSGRCIAGYLYAGAGFGESTTDLAWDSQGMVWENAVSLGETERYAMESQLLVADVDVERLLLDRMRMSSFRDQIEDHRAELARLRRVAFEFSTPSGGRILERAVDRFPYVPSSSDRLDERCEEVYNIQVQGLAQRLDATGIERVVIGVSGGLDSTQALMVATRTFDRLGLDRAGILAYTLPGLATSAHTYDNAWELMRCLGVTASEIDISDAATAMLERIGHPAAGGDAVYDVTFENVQAGERTSHLFRLANLHGALVVGTGDLSELALGWCTYGVGDQMAHYNVNASVPKTLIQHLIRWLARGDRVDGDTARVLQAIVDTEISPELVPGEDGGAGPAQRTEDVIGPFELQDFHLYYLSRFGFAPSKVAYLCREAWGSSYDLATIKKWLGVFLERFFGSSQFKRSALPNGPKVGSGGSLSPRGDWRAPSDVSAATWLAELEKNVPENA